MVKKLKMTVVWHILDEIVRIALYCIYPKVSEKNNLWATRGSSRKILKQLWELKNVKIVEAYAGSCSYVG